MSRQAREAPMKLLMFYTPRFAYRTFAKSLPEAETDERNVSLSDCVVLWVQAEQEDPPKGGKVVEKVVKNAKWLCGKFGTRRAVLHFFSHLSESRAEPAYARGLIEEAARRLANAGYEPHVTPFGYFCEMDLSIGGQSLAKVFKAF